VCLRDVLGEAYICGRDIGRCLYPLDSVAHLLDGIDERADVAGDIVEQVNGRHFQVSNTTTTDEGNRSVMCTVGVTDHKIVWTPPTTASLDQ